VSYCGAYGTPESKAEYGRLIAELAACPADVAPAPDAAITIIELIAAYWEFARGYYQQDGQPTRHVDRVRLALRPVKELYGTIAAESFGPLALRAIQTRLVGTGVSRGYVNDLLCEIKRLFKWGVSMELLPPSTYHALATVPGLKRGRTTAREPEPVKPVPDALVEATLQYLPPIVADMVRFQRYTGCRPGEACRVRPCDLERDGDVWTYKPASHKNAHRGRKRIIYIGPQAQRVLAPYLLRDPAAYCFSPAESVERHRLEMRAKRKSRVQPSQQGRRKARPKRAPSQYYRKDSYAWAISRAITRANRQRTAEAADTGTAIGTRLTGRSFVRSCFRPQAAAAACAHTGSRSSSSPLRK
jgi:integrase